MSTSNTTNLTNMTSSSIGLVNFAQNVRLLANQSESGRMVVPIDSSHTTSANNVSAMIGVIIAIVVASVFVVLAIGTALFKARRHIASWRLTAKSSKLDEENNDGANGALTQPSEEATGEQVEEAAAAASAMTADSVETANEVTIDTAAVERAGLVANEESKEQQISPSSASPLLNDEESKTAKNGEEEAGVKGEQITSSSSLIVNVINELSESVVCKLAVDPEKQALNE